VFKKTLVMTAPVLASAALVAGGLGAGTLSANAASAHHDVKAGFAIPAKSGSNETTCVGGAQEKTWNGGVHDVVYAQSNTGSTIVPGTIFRVKGPSSGRDVLSVNFSAMTYLDNTSYGQVKVLLDGVPMAPSDLNGGSPFYAQGYSTFSQNYCHNIGPGHHSLRVVIADVENSTSTGYFELYDPMIHAEKSE
jgi:hypothetical protein